MLWLSDPNFMGQNQKLIERLGTVHDLRFLIFDSYTRLLFGSTFDGDRDAYINDFAALIPDQIDLIFGESEGFPEMRIPNIKDWTVKHQSTSTYFYSGYPNAPKYLLLPIKPWHYKKWLNLGKSTETHGIPHRYGYQGS
jgi:hypothetical protein